MKTLTDVLSLNPLADLQTGQKVIAIEPENMGYTKTGFRVTSQVNGKEIQYLTKQVIFSTPANIASTLLKPVQPNLAELLNQIEYASIAQIHLGFELAGLNRTGLNITLEGNGFLVPSRVKIALRGSLWMSNLVNGRAPENKLLTSNFIGGGCQPEALNTSDENLIGQALTNLQQLTGITQTPEMVRLNRHRQGLPLYHGKYYQLTQAIESQTRQLPGVHFVANYLHGISIRDRIVQAKSVADQVCVDLNRQHKSTFSTVLLQPQQSEL